MICTRQLFLATIVFCLASSFSFAQSIACTSILLPDTIKTCANSSIKVTASLSVPSGYTILDTNWTPTNGVSDTNSISPTFSIGTSPVLYKLSIKSLTPNNLVNNGDFSAGNTGFSSNYRDTTGSGSLYPEGFYSVTTNPISVHPGFVSMTDHTTGTGNMMVVNGAGAAVSFWCQTIPVTPNTYYDFSAWGVTVSGAGNPAILQFSINGTLVGSALDLPTATGTWTEFHVVWYSGSNTSIDICITDQQTALGGNDFAIDDISFRQICFSTDSVYVKVGTIQDSIEIGQIPCQNGRITFDAKDLPGSIGANGYTWRFGDGTSKSGDTVSHIYGKPNTYPVKLYMSNANGCQDSVTTTVTVNNFPPAISKINDTGICPNDSIALWVSAGKAYNWTPADGLSNPYVQMPHASPTQTTMYYVSVTIDTTCITNDSIKVTVYNPKPLSIDYNGDIVSCLHPTVQLHVTNGSTYKWYPPSLIDDSLSADPNVSPVITTKFIVRSKDMHGCLLSDSVTVDVSDMADVFVPSAFTPNGDGRNDLLEPIEYCGFQLEHFEIYNRWGQLIFYALRNQKPGWDGKLNGVPSPIGTYFYYIDGMSREGRHISKKGDVELLR
jgi:gliding motility-associated-like protein